MKRIHKKTVLLVATIALLSSVALADGEMGGGGFGGYDTPTEKVVIRTVEDGAIGGGTTAANSNDEHGLNWLLSVIGEFIGLGE